MEVINKIIAIIEECGSNSSYGTNKEATRIVETLIEYLDLPFRKF